MLPAAVPVRIIRYQARYARDFKRLNLEWLRKYFRVEPIDEAVLSNPGKIIKDGGCILLARRGRQIVGTCALLPAANDRFELSKMAVTSDFQGAGIGRRLLTSAIAAFKATGARELFLDTNSVLVSAVSLYESLGFVHAPRPSQSPYQRTNVHMVYRQLD